MDLGLSDRTAVVTGGTGRIGSEDCRTIADEGADVVVLGVDEYSARIADATGDGRSRADFPLPLRRRSAAS
ncbi:hypothetical protein A6E15_17340 [Natrinema saccharevitans]|uniref:NAD-dependent epimerase/dehydratase domain-containing protein n=1 Tax=Natrinema saccharevitans TaxID=301967 RepID=A0A1S8AQS5_9EURY|nr:hypothetical protein A6E15_17340 [Natrinema saccharevitans]